MGKVFLLTSFLVTTPFLLAITLVYFSYFTLAKTNPLLGRSDVRPVAYAALPTTQNMIEGIIEQEDARIEIVRQFFSKYSSPLEPYADTIVKAADAYDLDFRLLPAIAMQESNLCRRAPANSYNCWGYGIYGGKVTRFQSYNEAIDTITRGMVKYKSHGLDTPEEIVKRYTPSDTGKWSNAVTYFMEKLQ